MLDAAALRALRGLARGLVGWLADLLTGCTPASVPCAGLGAAALRMTLILGRLQGRVAGWPEGRLTGWSAGWVAGWLHQVKQT